jgi:hypothetical protein
VPRKPPWARSLSAFRAQLLAAVTALRLIVESVCPHLTDGVERTMNTMQRSKLRSVALPVPLFLALAMMAVIALLSGCERSAQTADPYEDQVSVSQPGEDPGPMGHVAEFDGYTLRANVGRTDALPDAMAREYGIEPEPDHFLLNLVILEDRPDGQSVTVSAEVSARYEDLIGHGGTIDMRAAETDGHVAYIGTLDAGAQRVLEILIEAKPEGIEGPMRMNFEVRLEAFDIDDE